MNAGTVRIAPVDLVKLLGLSHDHQVLDVFRGSGARTRMIELVVVGPDMPECPDGELAPFVRLEWEATKVARVIREGAGVA